MTATPWQADFSRRLRIRNRLAELNASVGPLEPEPLPDWLDHYPSPEERVAMHPPFKPPPKPPTPPPPRTLPAPAPSTPVWGRRPW